MIGDLVRGGLAGAAATWVMDQVTAAMLSNQAPDVTAREEGARPNGQSAIANLVDRLDGALGLELTPDGKAALGNVVHFGLGVIPGALYAVLRRRLPLVGAAGGIGFGLLLWLVNDEYLNSALELAAPPAAYPAETHWRGLVGHAVLGAMTDAGVDLLGG